MKRGIATWWHLSFSAVAAALYFAFVLPRWWELTGETSHALGTAARITAGVLIALAALPVVFTLLRLRKPEFGTPALALSLLTASVVAHVLAGVLIAGTAISEIWLSLDSVGNWLFGVYGAAAAIAVLGVFGFYLSSVAELPPPPPKPIKPKKDKKQRRKRTDDESAEGEDDVTDTADAADEESEPADDADETPDVESTATEPESTADEAPASGDSEDIDETDDTAEASAGGLRNRRPTGKGSGSHRRRRSRRGVAVED